MKATRSELSHVTQSSGFTLLEVMISLAIIGLALAAVLHTVNYHSDILYRNTQKTIMYQLAKEKMYELQDNPADSEGKAGDRFIYTNRVRIDGNTGVARLVTTISGEGETVSLMQLRFGGEK
jgi:prepilin-type N-terminal cleavage/methylation domain-containing protein